MKFKSIFFILFFMMFINQIMILSYGYTDLTQNTVITYESGFNNDYYVQNGSDLEFNQTYSRNARVNFDGYSSGFDIFDSGMINNVSAFTMPIIDNLDYDENGNEYDCQFLHIDHNEYVGFVFEEDSAIGFDNTTYVGLSSVFNWIQSDSDNPATPPSDYVLKISGSFTDGNINYYLAQYNNNYYMALYSSIDAKSEYEYMYITLDETMPIFVGVELTNIHMKMFVGNVNGQIYNHTILHKSDPQTLNSFTLYYSNEYNTEYGGFYAMDFNRAYILSDEIYFNYDETFYLFRCLEFYELNDESYNLNDYNDYSLINESKIENFDVSTSECYLKTNLTDNNDYKLNDDLTNKTGIVQLGNIENPFLSNWNNNSGSDCSAYLDDIQNRENVIVLYDNDIVNVCDMSYDFSNQITGTIELFWLTDDSSKTSYFVISDGSSPAVKLYISGNSLRYWDGSGHTICSVSSNEWYDIEIDFDCSIDMFNISVNGVFLGNNLGFQVSQSSVNRFYLQTYSSDSNYKSIYDSIGFSFDDYVLDSNKYIGNQNYTKTVKSFHLSNLTPNTEIITFDDIEQERLFQIEYKFSFTMNGIVQWTNESDDSSLTVIWSNPNSTKNHDVSIPRVDIAIRDFNDRISYFGIYLFNNKSVKFYATYYDFYTQVLDYYVSDYYHGFYNQTNQIDNRIGINIQRDANIGFYITWFNSTILYSKYYSNRLTFGSDVSVRNIDLNNIDILGIIPFEDSNPLNTQIVLRGLLDNRFRLTQQNQIQSKTFTIPVLTGVNWVYGYISELVVYTYENISNNLWLEKDYSFTGIVNSTNKPYIVGNSELVKLNTSRELNPTDIEDYTINFFLNLVLYTDSILKVFNAITIFALEWTYYYSSIGTTFFGNIVNIITPIVLLTIFPIVGYRQYQKKGVIYGLIGGILILTFSGLLSISFAIIMIPVSIIVAYLYVNNERSEING